MDRYRPMIDKSECVKFFVNREERDLNILSAGYNDFRFVKPQFYTRNQIQHTIHFVIGGKGILHVGEKTFSVGRHQVFALDNKSYFSYYPEPNDPWEYVWFDFSGDFAERYFLQCGFSADTPVKDCSQPQKLLAEFTSLFSRLKEQRPVSYFSFLSAFYTLLSAVCGEQNETVFFYHEDYIEEIKRYIGLKYLNDDFSVDYLAKAMHISHSHLCKIFKQSEGLSVIAYVNALRMKRAAELLADTALSAREISFMSGFSEYEYFLKSFKKTYGMTTGEFRAKQTKKAVQHPVPNDGKGGTKDGEKPFKA